MKKRIVTLLLTLLTVLSLLPTVAMAAESTGVGITPVTDPNLWTTRLNSQGQTYSYRPPTAAGRQLYCMDLGYSYRSGTESFLQSYMYRSATGADADALWNDAVAETGLGEMDAITKENVKWMMSYITDYTGEIPGSLFMALQTYIWDNQSDKSAGGDPSGDIDAGGFANADTYDQYVEYYNWLLGQKANEDAEFQRQIEEYAAQGIHASIVEDESSKWAVLATSSVSGRQSFFAYHSGRKVIADDEPQDDDDPPPAGDGDNTFQKVIAGTDKGLDGAVYNIDLDGQIVGSDVTSGGGYIEVHDVTEGLWSFVEQEAPAGYALDPTPHSVYVSVTDGDKQYTVTVGDEELPGIKVIKTSAVDGSPVENAVYSIKGVTCAFSTSVSTGPDGSALVEDLLRLAQLDAGAESLEREPVELLALSQEVARRLEPAARSAGVSVEVWGAPVQVQGVRRVLDEMIYNLCENAIKYNRTGGRVTLTVGQGAEGPEVTVADTGIGIPPEDQSRVFERFYRVDKSHSKEIGGTGLGLSIVKHGALLHNAQIYLNSQVDRGTSIRISFPK